MPMSTPLSKRIRNRRWRCLAMLASLTLSGCSLIPAYQRPALPVPVDQASAVVPASNTSSAVVLSADEEALAGELSPKGELRRLLQSALAFNRDFRVAVLRVEEARAMRGITRADRFPTLAAGVERDRQHFDNAAADERYGQDISIASVGVSDFELDFFGRVRSLSEAARHDYLATTYGQQAARSALIAEVARAWLAERLAAAVQQDAQAVHEARLMLVKAAEEQQRQGALSLDDLMAQRLDTLSAQQQVQDAASDHANASQALLLLTGYSTVLPVSTPDTPALTAALVETPSWLSNLPSQRLLERFDIRQREEALKASNANIGAARAAFFPSIKLSTGVGLQSDSLRTLFSNGSGAWLFTPQLNLPLFDGGRNQANLDLAKVRQQIAVAEYEKAVQNAFREMSAVLTRRQQALNHVRNEVERVALVQEKVRRLSFELNAGAVERTALLVSTLRIAEADAAARQSLDALQQNRIDLFRVLHGAEPTTPPQS
ncbi:RND efflux system, outer membrane lipoprotein [Pseudomonas syringae pv. aptata]|jgi:multidrug efflux system outer membrane protein|uniref:efflux transporter outer membrane subunit n=1 Tax=Pseudomonas syringae group TaxID=136849 RepID=UPI000EFE6B14|nr:MULTISPECIES: efflux transporter outer membrane subunit [Pseudomonas syringae group]MCK9705971.1 efflux transporter outer membrane subunit [Pseudomonas syringae pv. syringae]MCK9750142.1 efflux transporter outer membrane subunit [Pseudomonas syringae pv. syringae]MCZ0948160.1 efflux transporter outer membrane subunit [Pseudomonas syringae pv. tomato]RMM45808.1 RND efflux system, outer membrane lipoprotein [Pseudomonas syringae pv. aptata]